MLLECFKIKAIGRTCRDLCVFLNGVLEEFLCLPFPTFGCFFIYCLETYIDLPFWEVEEVYIRYTRISSMVNSSSSSSLYHKDGLITGYLISFTSSSVNCACSDVHSMLRNHSLKFPRRKPVSSGPSASPAQPSPYAESTIAGDDDASYGDASYEDLVSELSSLRSSNPNLQPLCSRAEDELERKPQRPMSLDATTAARSSASLSNRSSSSSHTATSSIRHSVGSPLDLRRKSNKVSRHKTQKFWKYHILELGTSDLYLTTNPTQRHLMCRNAPSIHVQVQFPQCSKDGAQGFRMVFRDELENSVFMTITKRQDASFVVDGLKKFVLDDEGEVEPAQDFIAKHFMCKEVPVDEFKRVRLEMGDVKPIRYQILDTNLTVGSVIHQRQFSTKLKNKRFVYCQRDSHTTLSLFRPHEQRLKKRVLSKMNRKLNTNSTVYHEESDLADCSTYYSPEDGLTSKTPLDDCPNSDKLGWITIFEDASLHTVGEWDTVLGMTLAVGYSKTLESK